MVAAKTINEPNSTENATVYASAKNLYAATRVPPQPAESDLIFDRAKCDCAFDHEQVKTALSVALLYPWVKRSVFSASDSWDEQKELQRCFLREVARVARRCDSAFFAFASGLPVSYSCCWS